MNRDFDNMMCVVCMCGVVVMMISPQIETFAHCLGAGPEEYLAPVRMYNEHNRDR